MTEITCKKCFGFEYEIDGCLRCHLREKLKELKSLTAKNKELEEQLKDSRNAHDHLASEYRNITKAFKDLLNEAKKRSEQ